MPVSKRYECVLAALNDPLNMAIAKREVMRRLERMTPPPIPRVGGGLVYLTFEEYCCLDQRVLKDTEKPESYAEVFGSPGEWYIETDEGQVGPFSDLSAAKLEAERLLAEEGVTVLRDHPWTESDAGEYPL
jgi:hypothetical protein